MADSRTPLQSKRQERPRRRRRKSFPRQRSATDAGCMTNGGVWAKLLAYSTSRSCIWIGASSQVWPDARSRQHPHLDAVCVRKCVCVCVFVRFSTCRSADSDGRRVLFGVVEREPKPQLGAWTWNGPRVHGGGDATPSSTIVQQSVSVATAHGKWILRGLCVVTVTS